MNRLRELRKAKGVNQQTVADYLNVSRSTIAMWELGNAEPDNNNLLRLSEYYGVSIDYILGATKNSPSVESELGDVIQFPVIGTIAAGYNGQAAEEYTGEYAYFAASYVNNSEDYFALRVQGDSMYPKLLNGDVVLVKRTTSVDSGKTAVIMFNGEDATVKKVNYVSGEDWMELVPVNPEFKARRIEGADLEQCRVLGEVIALQRTL